MCCAARACPTGQVRAECASTCLPTCRRSASTRPRRAAPRRRTTACTAASVPPGQSSTSPPASRVAALCRTTARVYIRETNTFSKGSSQLTATSGSYNETHRDANARRMSSIFDVYSTYPLERRLLASMSNGKHRKGCISLTSKPVADPGCPFGDGVGAWDSHTIF